MSDLHPDNEASFEQADVAQEPMTTPVSEPDPIPVMVTDASPTTKQGPSFVRWVLETILMIGLAFLLAQGIKTFVVQPFVIPTGSMEPTIMAGDRVLAEKLTYRFREVEPGEIVVFDDPTGRHPQLIKRVVAVGGQTLDIDNGKVVVDGELLEEPFLLGVKTDPGSVILPITLAEDEVWLMGDNRPNSGDSRFMGAVPRSMVQGRGFAIYWPFDRIGPLR